MSLVDENTRQRIVSTFDRCFLVEAAAGTGKTSLLAGRVTMMLAHGYRADQIAAITFTEPAASELKHKIQETIDRLLAGDVPRFLKSTLPNGLGDLRETLEAAARTLDQLTTTTVHGFCQAIIDAHGVTAGLDPGARIVDEAQASQIFEAEFAVWFESRLADTDAPDDPVINLARAMPRKVVELLRELADLRREHRQARAMPPLRDSRPDIDFTQAVDDFVRWQASLPPQTWTLAIAVALGKLRSRFDNVLSSVPRFADLWSLAHPEHDRRLMPKDKTSLFDYANAAEACGAFGDEWRDDAAEQRYAVVEQAWRVLQGHFATNLVASISECLDGLLAGYDARKRASAVLDFDDLITHARTLIREHEAVRVAVGERYPFILIDEAQDTDPTQFEILFSIAAEQRPDHWADAKLRPGSLFLVGDPKQAIYRFRGADIAAYEQARTVIEAKGQGEVLRIMANFRCQPRIVDEVNRIFEPIFKPPRQPQYVALAPTVEANGWPMLPVCGSTTMLDGEVKAHLLRDAEADRVAELCERLVGNLEVATDTGSRPLRRSDIALLSPGHRDLWRYERALEARRITVASQAGRSLMLRQETQDVLTLLRVLLDASDTLAFGALMRGPLVGLTDGELLDVTAGLPPTPSGRYFSMRTRAEDVAHPLAKLVLEDLQKLRRRVDVTTPSALLAEAIEALRLRVVMALRHRHRNPRALANLDALIERARSYDVAGLRSFVDSLQHDWARGPEARVSEGRADAADDAVQIVTMHTAKGLEWPVVIPINTTSEFQQPRQFVWRQSDQTLHWIIGNVVPPELELARLEEEEEESRQRERLWYVTCTRAKDLLVLPTVPQAARRSWNRVVDLTHPDIHEIDVETLVPREPVNTAETNDQTASDFAADATRIARASMPTLWVRPSEQDGDRLAEHAEPVVVLEALGDRVEILGAGALRGNILHKLMEELLLRDVADDEEALEARAAALLLQLAPPEASDLPVPREMARCALDTIGLEEVASRRHRLVPEFAAWGTLNGELLAGRIDALEITDDGVACVFDWKSDRDPSASARASHEAQLRAYLAVTGCPIGAVVYMTRKQVRWVQTES